MKPVKAKDLLELDKNLKTVVLQCYPIPEQVIYQAAKCDYSETPIYEQKIPEPSKCGKWVVDTLLANDRGHYGCYSEDTEVMTENGWKLWPQVTYDDKLAAVDIETSSIKFEYPTALQQYDMVLGDKLYSIESQKISLSVTQDHRMVYSTITNKSWRFSTAASLAGKAVIYKLAGDLCDEDRKIPDDCPTDYNLLNVFKLAGFFFGDGVRGHTKKPTYLQFRLRRDRKIKYLKSLGFNVIDMKDDKFKVDLGDTADWISRNFTNSNGKICPTFILKLPKNLFEAFLDGLKNSDGTLKRKTWAYDSTSLESLELVQAACHLNGMSATLTLNHPNIGPGHENHNPGWRLHISSVEPIARFEVNQKGRTKGTEKLIPYDGKVYCATVSTGALLVRKNRRPVVSGNCLEHPQITFAVSGYVHSVMVQGRTHRIGNSWDCLAGESQITVEGENKVTIEKLYEIYEQQESLPLVRNLNEDRGYFDYAEIGRVFKNPQKDIYLVKLEDGKELKCSMDHRIFTENGWQRLKELNVGDRVACNGVATLEALKTHYVSIESIEFLRTDITYDIEVDGKYHNFVCDGVVVHNCQSQRYTGKRVVKVANDELPVDEVFYIRPPGFYTNRQGKKYEWTLADYNDEMDFIYEGCKRYAAKYEKGMCEEHIRDYLSQAIRQNFVVSFNLRSVLHFMDLRSKMDAQLEIQALCSQMEPLIEQWAPHVWKYYEEKRLHRAKLSP